MEVGFSTWLPVVILGVGTLGLIIGVAYYVWRDLHDEP